MALFYEVEKKLQLFAVTDAIALSLSLDSETFQ